MSLNYEVLSFLLAKRYGARVIADNNAISMIVDQFTAMGSEFLSYTEIMVDGVEIPLTSSQPNTGCIWLHPKVHLLIDRGGVPDATQGWTCLVCRKYGVHNLRLWVKDDEVAGHGPCPCAWAENKDTALYAGRQRVHQQLN